MDKIAAELVKLAKGLVGSSKEYYVMENIGHAKYTVNFHDGVSTHKDGSEFYDIKIFKNRPSMEAFIRELERKGYKEGKSPIYKDAAGRGLEADTGAGLSRRDLKARMDRLWDTKEGFTRLYAEIRAQADTWKDAPEVRMDLVQLAETEVMDALRATLKLHDKMGQLAR